MNNPEPIIPEINQTPYFEVQEKRKRSVDIMMQKNGS
jgi:hypothetical protein